MSHNGNGFNRLVTVRNGRGQFAPGTAPGPGNPRAATSSKWRAALDKALKKEDIIKAVAVLREVMEKGNDRDRLTAADMVLNRSVGKPLDEDISGRLDRLEQATSDRLEAHER